jgi:hypothetical protein
MLTDRPAAVVDQFQRYQRLAACQSVPMLAGVVGVSEVES